MVPRAYLHLKKINSKIMALICLEWPNFNLQSAFLRSEVMNVSMTLMIFAKFDEICIILWYINFCSTSEGNRDQLG